MSIYENTTDGNFFKVSHSLEDYWKDKLSITNRHFLIVLLHLENRYKNEDGWFWHKDKQFPIEKGEVMGFESYGFSASTAKRARKTLSRLNIIETKRSFMENGFCFGMYYKINHQVLDHAPVVPKPRVEMDSMQGFNEAMEWLSKNHG